MVRTNKWHRRVIRNNWLPVFSPRLANESEECINSRRRGKVNSNTGFLPAFVIWLLFFFFFHLKNTQVNSLFLSPEIDSFFCLEPTYVPAFTLPADAHWTGIHVVTRLCAGHILMDGHVQSGFRADIRANQ